MARSPEGGGFEGVGDGVTEDWAFVQGRADFYCVSFQAPRMDKCVSYYLSVKEAQGVCVGFV